MSDEITEEDRRLIDEATAAGRVRTIPAGYRALAGDEFVFKEGLGKLVHANPKRGKQRMRNSIKWGRSDVTHNKTK